MSYDDHCYALARHYLPGEEERILDELAQLLHDEARDFILWLMNLDDENETLA